MPMKIYHLTIHPNTPTETAWEKLETAGIEVLYSDEDLERRQKVLVCRLENCSSQVEQIAGLPEILSISAAPDLAIDWETQWSQHGLDFHDGLVHVHVGETEFSLKPGPGFGDASHPTTRLILQMMETHVSERAVLDIGCGSGVLSLAAIYLKAHPVYAIDIDPEAIRHTIENIGLNDVKRPIWVGSTEELIDQCPNKPLIALMNMIFSEQELAWSALKPIHHRIEECITSGILTEEKDAYIALWHERGWQLNKAEQEGCWQAFHFIKRG